jgi:Cep192 domain 4
MLAGLGTSNANAALPILTDQVTDFDSLGLPPFSDIDPPSNVIDDLTYERWRYDPTTGSTAGIMSTNSPSDSDLATTKIKILSSDGSEFKATSIDYSAFVGGIAPYNLALYGYKDGVQVPSYVLSRPNISPPANETLSLNWDAVDEIRVVVNTDYIVFDNFAAGSASLDKKVFSNRNQPSKFPGLNIEVTKALNPPLAVPFTTNATDTELKKIKLNINNASSSSIFRVKIYDIDNSGSAPKPGASLATMQGPANLAEGLDGEVEFLFPAPLSLQPNTSYYIVLQDNLSRAVTSTLTRIGTGSDIAPAKYTLGIPGVSPTTQCSYRNQPGDWHCDATTFSTTVFPLMDIVALPPAPSSYSLTANPKKFDFGSVPLNTESPATTITVHNDGGASQLLGTVSVSSGFVLKSDSCSNMTLAVSASCNVSVAFTPTSGGQTVGALTIIPDPVDTTSQYLVPLGGSSTAAFSVGGALSGLATGESAGILLNGHDLQVLSTDGPFSYPSQNDGAGYVITIDSQPTGQTCNVLNSSGFIAGADVSNIAVNCVDNHYKVGGLVAGLVPGDALVIQNNGMDDLTITSDGVFNFATRVAYQDPYAVTVKVQPSAPSETCTVSNGSSTMGTADISNIAINCAVDRFTVGGSVNGLIPPESVELLLNGAHRQSLGANGSFVFPALADATSYNVTIGAQPSGQTCTVNNGSGTLAGGNVSNVQVSCVANKYNVGGLLSGLAAGKTAVITNNGGDDLSLTADGAFTFGTQVESGGGYSIAIKTQPVGETCTVTNGAGTVATADINQVSITCIVDTYRVSGNLTGLATGDSVELLLNSSLHTVMTGSGYFQFPSISDGSAYNVTIGRQPAGQTCSVSNGSGTIAGADVKDVAVDCLDNTVTGPVTGTNPSGVAAGITISGCSSLINATFIPAPDSPSKPAGFDFPYGLVDFSASGCSTLANGIKVTLDFAQPIDAGAVLYKEEGVANAYFPFSATLSGSSATFLLTDNGPGDEDGAIGEIHDPAGIAVPLAGPVPPAPGSPAPIPVMPLWLLVMLGSLISLIASMHVKLRS